MEHIKYSEIFENSENPIEVADVQQMQGMIKPLSGNQSLKKLELVLIYNLFSNQA